MSARRDVKGTQFDIVSQEQTSFGSFDSFGCTAAVLRKPVVVLVVGRPVQDSRWPEA